MEHNSSVISALESVPAFDYSNQLSSHSISTSSAELSPDHLQHPQVITENSHQILTSNKCTSLPDNSLVLQVPLPCHQSYSSLADSSIHKSTPTTAATICTPTTATTIRGGSNIGGTATLHNAYFRKLPRAYRSPSPIYSGTASTINSVEYFIASQNKSTVAHSSLPLSEALFHMSSSQHQSSAMSANKTNRTKSNTRLLSALRARGVGDKRTASSIPCSETRSVEVLLSSPTNCGTPITPCLNDSRKPHSRSIVSTPSSTMADTVCMTAPTITAAIHTPNKTNDKKAARYSFQLSRRQGSSSEGAPASGSDKHSSRLSTSLRNRDNPRGEDYIAKQEIESKRGDLWDQEGDQLKTMTMLPRWKAAFGRARGKSIEGGQGEPSSSSNSSPLRRNPLASRSQPDLTRLQKMFREEASAERMNMPVMMHSPLSYSATPPATRPSHSPLVVVAANEEHQRSMRGPPPVYAARHDTFTHQRDQAGSCHDQVPSISAQPLASARYTSPERPLTGQTKDSTSLQPRQKRNRFLLRRPGTTQGLYTAPNTPSIRTRPGTSGESSNRAPFVHPASDPVISKRLLPVRPKTSSAADKPTIEQSVPDIDRRNQVDWSRIGYVNEVSPQIIPMPNKRKVEATSSRSCNSPLLQVLSIDRPQRPPLSPPFNSSPLFHSLKEDSKQSWEHQQNLLLSPAQILDPPPKRLSSNEKVKELRRTMKGLEDAMSFNKAGRFDTPRSSLSRFTEAASSVGSTAPYSNQSNRSTMSAQTFYGDERGLPHSAGAFSETFGRQRESACEIDEDHNGEKRPIDKNYRKSKCSSEDAGDVTIIPSLAIDEEASNSNEVRDLQQRSIFEQYCLEHPMRSRLLSPIEQESRRGSNSNDSRGTIMCTTDSTASYSLDAEFWLVQAAEKKIITARAARSATVSSKGDAKLIEEQEEGEVQDIRVDKRSASVQSKGERTTLQSKGVNVHEEKEPHSLRVEVKLDAMDSADEERVVLLTSSDIDAIGRAWFRGKTSRLSLLYKKESKILQGSNVEVERSWEEEQRAFEQRQREILDTGGIFRVHSAPAFVRSLSNQHESKATKKWQRKALVLTTRFPRDQATVMEEPLRSDGSTRQYLVSPQATSFSSRPSSPNKEIVLPKVRTSRSPIGPAPLAYKRSCPSFTNEGEPCRLHHLSSKGLHLE